MRKVGNDAPPITGLFSVRSTGFREFDSFMPLGSDLVVCFPDTPGLAVARAQEESRRLGVPNVYSINGRLSYETPTDELSAVDPFTNGERAAEPRGERER